MQAYINEKLTEAITDLRAIATKLSELETYVESSPVVDRVVAEIGTMSYAAKLGVALGRSSHYADAAKMLADRFERLRALVADELDAAQVAHDAIGEEAAA